jgi:DNA (cytosine-5)-methyltransferase 1
VERLGEEARMLTVLDLFSGIGGFSLGLERAGMKTIQFVEIDPFCRKVLKKHWPEVPQHDDIKTYTGTPGFADVICGGFPCQDLSYAGKGEGIEGARSGLWKEYARLIGEVRPRFVIVENVSALLGRGLGVVLGALAALGYDAEWHCIPASAVGAPHRRDRVWILAHRNSNRLMGGESRSKGHQGEAQSQPLNGGQVANARGERFGEPGEGEFQQQGRTKAICTSEDVANATSLRRDGHSEKSGSDGASSEEGRVREPTGTREDVSDASSLRCDTRGAEQPLSGSGAHGASQLVIRGLPEGSAWGPEPELGRVAYGVPDRVDRLKSLGNAVVPQIPELIGRAILEAA